MVASGQVVAVAPRCPKQSAYCQVWVPNRLDWWNVGGGAAWCMAHGEFYPDVPIAAIPAGRVGRPRKVALS